MYVTCLNALPYIQSPYGVSIYSILKPPTKIPDYSIVPLPNIRPLDQLTCFSGIRSNYFPYDLCYNAISLLTHFVPSNPIHCSIPTLSALSCTHHNVRHNIKLHLTCSTIKRNLLTRPLHHIPYHIQFHCYITDSWMVVSIRLRPRYHIKLLFTWVTLRYPAIDLHTHSFTSHPPFRCYVLETSTIGSPKFHFR